MSENPSAVYSCPSCGALSQVDAGADDGVVCEECGHQFKRPVHVAPRNVTVRGLGAGKFVQRDVVLRRRQGEHAPVVLPPQRPEARDAIEVSAADPEAADETTDADWDDQVVSDDGHKRVVRRRKKRRKTVSTRPLILGAVWIVVMAAVMVALAFRFRNQGQPEISPTASEQAADKAERAEMRAYIDKHLPDCRVVLEEFWGAPSVEKRGLHVFPGHERRVIPLMSNFETQHGPLKQPDGEVSVIGRNLIVRDEFRAIETHWMDESGKRSEVVFVRDAGEWKIDWESYVRYCSTRWDVFVSTGFKKKEKQEEQGDFRVLMREGKGAETKDGLLRVQFYPSDYQTKNGDKGESEVVTMPEDSLLGRRVRAVLDGLEREVQPGEPAAWKNDPKGYARVRVVLEWRKDLQGREPILILNDLLAGAWRAEELVQPLLVGEDDDAAESGDSGEDG